MILIDIGGIDLQGIVEEHQRSKGIYDKGQGQGKGQGGGKGSGKGSGKRGRQGGGSGSGGSEGGGGMPSSTELSYSIIIFVATCQVIATPTTLLLLLILLLLLSSSSSSSSSFPPPPRAWRESGKAANVAWVEGDVAPW